MCVCPVAGGGLDQPMDDGHFRTWAVGPGSRSPLRFLVFIPSIKLRPCSVLKNLGFKAL